MIEYYYSNIKPDKLLHLVIRPGKSKPGRVDAVSELEFLQCAVLNVKQGGTYKPHRHIWKDGPRTMIPQESWLVIRGKVKCIFYDIDNKLLAIPVLNAGDLSITLEGGHNYEILEDGIIIEYKTGPYSGQKNDKEFI